MTIQQLRIWGLAVAAAGVTLFLCSGQGCIPDPVTPDGGQTPDGQTPDGGQGGTDEKDVPVISSFQGGDEGWRLQGGDFASPVAPQLGEGFVKATGEGHWYWVAPDAFHGNLSKSFGKAITFDFVRRKIEGASCNQMDFRVLLSNSAGRSIHCRLEPPGITVWTAYQVMLDEAASWLNADDDKRVTNDIIREVLSDLTEFKIMSNPEACHKIESFLGRVAFGADVASEQPVAVPVEATFDSTAEGWTVLGGDFLNPTAPQAVDGALQMTGAGHWFWLAGDEFRGNFSLAYGHTIQFDMSRTRLSGASCRQLDYRLRLSGGGFTLYYLLGEAPSELGTSYVIQLTESVEWFDEATDHRATAEQLRSTLADLRHVEILANHEVCHNIVSTLDNFVLGG